MELNVLDGAYFLLLVVVDFAFAFAFADVVFVVAADLRHFQNSGSEHLIFEGEADLLFLYFECVLQIVSNKLLYQNQKR